MKIFTTDIFAERVAMGGYYSLVASFQILVRNPSLLALGLMNALYEGALYIFVFLWTPCLEERVGQRDLPHG